MCPLEAPRGVHSAPSYSLDKALIAALQGAAYPDAPQVRSPHFNPAESVRFAGASIELSKITAHALVESKYRLDTWEIEEVQPTNADLQRNSVDYSILLRKRDKPAIAFSEYVEVKTDNNPSRNVWIETHSKYPEVKGWPFKSYDVATQHLIYLFNDGAYLSTPLASFRRWCSESLPMWEAEIDKGNTKYRVRLLENPGYQSRGFPVPLTEALDFLGSQALHRFEGEWERRAIAIVKESSARNKRAAA